MLFSVIKEEKIAPSGYAYVFVTKRFFSAARRRDLAKSGAALPDGSFPILNAEDLRNAISLWRMGRDPSKAKAHIKSRASALGLTSKLPKDWR
jgi:hypothetical protein